MKDIARLPSGYKDRVIKAKSICNSLVKYIKESNINDITSRLVHTENVDDVSVYTGIKDGKEYMHIDFDVHLITQLNLELSVYIEVYATSIKLSDTCTIYIRDYAKFGDELRLANYKW